MNVVWPIWLVFVCVVGLAGILKPEPTAAKPTAIAILLGLLTFLVWVTHGRLAVFIPAGTVVALPLLLGLAGRAAGLKGALPTGTLLTLARRALGPAVAFGTFIGVAFEVGGRLYGAEFVVWSAAAFGIVATTVGVVFFARAMRSAGQKTQ